MMSDDFEPRFEGMSFSHSIDGHGWPDSVTVSNGKDIFDGYSSREYVPYEEVRELLQKAKPMKPDITVHNGFCPNCHQAFGLERTKEAMIRPRWFSFCPYCGQALDWGKR